MASIQQIENPPGERRNSLFDSISSGGGSIITKRRGSFTWNQRADRRVWEIFSALTAAEVVFCFFNFLSGCYEIGAITLLCLLTAVCALKSRKMTPLIVHMFFHLLDFSLIVAALTVFTDYSSIIWYYEPIKHTVSAQAFLTSALLVTCGFAMIPPQ
eukprot:GDKI01039792.1.p1 GENE.GDKI01039792.1~~GDKI01039792.1.p1  ORF type:complete len:157 (-),score=29.24 GDKI01039792.1:5-475(-)